MRANRRDQNEAEIVRALRKMGATVDLIEGKPYDALIGYGRRNYVVEFKTPKGKLSDSQRKFQRDWAGYYSVVRSVDDAMIVLDIGGRAA